MQKANCFQENCHCSIFLIEAYSTVTKGLATRRLAILAPFHPVISWTRHPHYGERIAFDAFQKGYRTMLSFHDHVTSPMCDRLETSSIGLGLVRLLQDAKRFDEARMLLYALESGFQSAKAKPGKRTQKLHRLSRPTMIGAA